MTTRVSASTQPRFADRLSASGQDVPYVPTRYRPTKAPAASRHDQLDLTTVGRFGLSMVTHPVDTAGAFWDRLTDTVSSVTGSVTALVPNWLKPAPIKTPSGKQMSVKRVGQGYHLIGSLPKAARKDNGGLDPRAKASFQAMTAAAARAGIVLTVSSSYRSHSHQKKLWDRSDKTGRWVAAPGHSEHQTGLVYDIGTKGYRGGKSGNFGKSPAFRWLQENGYKYGFVQSMSWEPWHWRFDPQAVAAATGQRSLFA